MRFYKAMLLPMLAAALAVYALDCDAAATPEQAMHCCDSMSCSPQGHQGQDCCATMPTMHAPFVQSSSVQGTLFSPAMFAVLPVFGEADRAVSSALSIAEHSHAPPVVLLFSSLPLRI
jgi:hypothetical protein